jgi:RNA polymerase sigma factor (sigma-70 family)
MPDPFLSLLNLLDQEGRPLHALLTRLTLDPHAAEDLMQDLFLKLAANPAFTTAKNPPAYLRQAAIHLALDWRRARLRTNTITALPDPPDPAPLPAAALADHEQWSRILDAAAFLPTLTREAFILHYVQQHSSAEIAAILDKTPHQIRALCHKAITALQTQLAAPNKEACHAPE